MEPKLDRLFQSVRHVVPAYQEHDDVGVRRLRLDEIGRVVGGAERNEIAARSRSPQRGRGL